MKRRYRVTHNLSADELREAVHGILAEAGLEVVVREPLAKSEGAGPEPERFLREVVQLLVRILRTSALGALTSATALPDLTKPIAVGVMLNDLRLRFQETIGLAPVAHSGGRVVDGSFTAPLADLARIGALREPVPDEAGLFAASQRIPESASAERFPAPVTQLRAQLVADAWFGRVLAVHTERLTTRGDGLGPGDPVATLDPLMDDLERLVATQARLAYHTGLIRGAEQRGVGVAFQVAPDACHDCKRLLLTADGTPKTFSPSALLMAGGPNRGPRKDWVACIVQHPWCRCRPHPLLGGRG